LFDSACAEEISSVKDAVKVLMGATQPMHAQTAFVVEAVKKLLQHELPSIAKQAMKNDMIPFLMNILDDSSSTRCAYVLFCLLVGWHRFRPLASAFRSSRARARATVVWLTFPLSCSLSLSLSRSFARSLSLSRSSCIEDLAGARFHSVEALQLMERAPDGIGTRAAAQLGDFPSWERYKYQKHDLFVMRGKSAGGSIAAPSAVLTQSAWTSADDAAAAAAKAESSSDSDSDSDSDSEFDADI
jgi:hypothetical protein